MAVGSGYRWVSPLVLGAGLCLMLAGCSSAGSPKAAASTTAPPASASQVGASAPGTSSTGTSSTAATGTTSAPSTTTKPPAKPSTKPPAKPSTKPTTKAPAGHHAKGSTKAHHAAPSLLPKGTILYEGDSGHDVLVVQQRLTQLGYWVGTPDGYYGDSTVQAVYALQKAAGITRDGAVGPQTEAALEKGVVPTPRKAAVRTLIEVDLEDDLVMFVHDGKLRYVLNTSTGGGYTYSDQGASYIAATPVGVFHVYYAVNGTVTDSLGQLFMPRYFDSGFAIHGDGYVPPYPVSHGCVRVSDEAIEWIWANDLAPIGTEVWVY